MSATQTKKYLYEVGSLEQRSSSPSQILAMVGTHKRVLEVGCASGTQTRVLKERLHCTVTGLEIDPQAAEMARPFCDRLIVGSIEQLDLAQVLGAQTFDVVMFADVLEHLYDPVQALQKVAPLLAEGGRVLASIPNVAHVSVVVELIRGNFEYRPFGLLDNTHIRFFTKKSIVELFEQAGYRLLALDRAIAPNHDTDGQPAAPSPERQAIADLVRRHSPECDTFQFIVAAGRATGGEPLPYVELEPPASATGTSAPAQAAPGATASSSGQAASEPHRAKGLLSWIKRSVLG